ncbi:DNA replication complex GINS family protein [Thermococcus sp.]|uniref:DNA replication complex GINS family protein n=1 Tax=Thermococcus sp. TaxID=35749 RepID=UPI00262E9C1A|nr:DNA replication complex GINS family protein [Thermococcus sp.]
MPGVRVPVRVLKPLANFKEEDTVLLPEEAVKVLWSYGLVEVVDEMDRMVSEVDRVLTEEKENEPLSELPKGLYERAEFWMWYAENYIRQHPEDTKAITVTLAKLANLKKKVRDLRTLRLNKILKAAMLRPHSDTILSRLSPEEAEVYEYLSDFIERWLE